MIKNQLDVSYYFIVLLIGSTCFGHYYAHHHELVTMLLITMLVVSFCNTTENHTFTLKTNPSIFTEQNNQFGNQQHSREILMMGIVMPETC